MTATPVRLALDLGVGPAEPTVLASLSLGIDGAGGGGAAADGGGRDGWRTLGQRGSGARRFLDALSKKNGGVARGE